MAEPEQIDDTAPAATDTPPGRSRAGRTLAVFALVLLLGTAGYAGYVGWQAWQPAQEDALAALEARFAAWEQRRIEETQQRQRELEALAAHVETELAALRQSQAQYGELVAAAERDDAEPQGWRLAEAQYLMRVANHRLLMERDADAAENLLTLAAAVLAEIGPLAYHDVRALLAEEIASLRAYEAVDAQAVYLRLHALKGQLDLLPLRLPEYSAPRPGTAAEETAEAPPASLAGTLVERLSGVIRFRRHDGEAVRPLLAPRQAEYLQLHLRLALDRAQLAALRHDQEVYRASLDAARDWLRRFVDPTRPTTEQLARELDALLGIDLDAQLPDISRSSSRLRTLANAERDAP